MIPIYYLDLLPDKFTAVIGLHYPSVVSPYQNPFLRRHLIGVNSLSESKSHKGHRSRLGGQLPFSFSFFSFLVFFPLSCSGML